MSHEVVRKNRKQSLSLTPPSGKKANWNDLFPDAMLDELWQLIEHMGIPGRFHVHRKGGPEKGANGKIGVRILTLNSSQHVIFLSFQSEMKGARTKYTLEPPNPGGDVPEIEAIHGKLKQLGECRNHKGVLTLPEKPVPQRQVHPPKPAPAVDSAPPTPDPKSGQLEQQPSPAVFLNTAGEKVDLNWEDEGLQLTFMRLLREHDTGYEAGWIPIADVMELLGFALEERGMQAPAKLDGRTAKRFFSALVENDLLERTGPVHAIKYRECRRQSLSLSGDLVADVTLLAEMSSRFEALDASIKQASGELSPLIERRDELQRELEALVEEIDRHERRIEAARREIESERLDEAVAIRQQLLKSLQG